MPVILPPPFLDVPAIVRAAAHSSARPAQIQHPNTIRPPVVIRPNGNGQFPDPTPGPSIVAPPVLGPAPLDNAHPTGRN